MGCKRDEPYQVDHKRKTVYLCRKLAEHLYLTDEQRLGMEKEEREKGLADEKNETIR